MAKRSKRKRDKSKNSRKKHGGWPLQSIFRSSHAATAKQANKTMNELQAITLAIKELNEMKKLLSTPDACSHNPTLNDIIISFNYGNFPIAALGPLNAIIGSMIHLVLTENFGLTQECTDPHATIQSGICVPRADGDKKIFNITEFKTNILQLIPSNVEDIKKLLNPSGGVRGTFGAVTTLLQIAAQVAANPTTILHIKKKVAAGAWKDLKVKEVVEVLETLNKSIIPKLDLVPFNQGNQALVEFIEKIITFLNIFKPPTLNVGICDRERERQTINKEIEKLEKEEEASLKSPPVGGRGKSRRPKKTRRRSRKRRVKTRHRR